jgi:hypothetical protein
MPDMSRLLFVSFVSFVFNNPSDPTTHP